MPLHEVPLHMQVLYTVHCCAVSMFIMYSKAPDSDLLHNMGNFQRRFLVSATAKLVTASRY